MVEKKDDDDEPKPPAWMNSLQLLNTIQWKLTYKGLIYMDIKMSGQKIIAMVDSRVTHNFVMSRRATRLGI